jgi:hypothetical protein
VDIINIGSMPVIMQNSVTSISWSDYKMIKLKLQINKMIKLQDPILASDRDFNDEVGLDYGSNPESAESIC